jgi:hypothetical protein
MNLDDKISELMILREQYGGKTFVCGENDKDGLYVLTPAKSYVVDANDAAGFELEAPDELRPKEGEIVILI